MGEEATAWGGELWAAADLVTPMAIRVAATLRLADHIVAGTQTTEALAAAVDADRDTLERVLEHLVTARVLSHAETGGYRLTDLGQHLRDDDPDGLRPWLDLDGAVGRADLSVVQLLHTVRTGEPGFPRQFGRSFWDDLSADPRMASSFDALMGYRLVADAPTIADSYAWGTLGHVVDVGGGDGSLLIAILRAHGELRGTVIDLPGPAAHAEQAFESAGLSARAEAKAGSFFDPLPRGAGGYVLSGVLRDWDDEHALHILKRCAEASADTGTVFVIEESLDGGAADTGMDLRLLSFCGGRDRTLDQLREMAASVGLEVHSVSPAGRRSIVELRHAVTSTDDARGGSQR